MIEDNNLNISTIYPSQGEKNVNVKSNITISFTREINKGTILKNFLVLKDFNKSINVIDDIQNCFHEIVVGRIKYDNKTITFEPDKKLEYGCRYVIIIRKHMQGIFNEALERDSLFVFNTEELKENTSVINIPNLTYPSDMSIINKLNYIEWKHEYTSGYIIQVSDTNEFNNLEYEYKTSEDIKSCTIDKNLDDGCYYIRVKSLDSDWSEVVCIYIQNVSQSPVSVNDSYLDDVDDLLKELNEPIPIIIEVKPLKRVTVNNNRYLITINKIINHSEFKCYLTKVKDVLNDEELNEELTVKSKTFLFDESKDVTYIVIEV